MYNMILNVYNSKDMYVLIKLQTNFYLPKIIVAAVNLKNIRVSFYCIFENILNLYSACFNFYI